MSLHTNGSVAQLVEQEPLKLLVVGSSPTRSTIHVYSLRMMIRVFSLTALLTHVLLGNLCMMPMAMAQEDVSAKQHDMTSMSSHAEGTNTDAGDMPCDHGHCFAHALPTESSFTTMAGFLVCPSMAFSVTPPFVVDDIPVPVSAAPPGHYIHTKTIVLRN